MRKKDELTNQSSCINKALADELTFVLLGRDAAAPDAIRMWASVRVRTGKNEWTDKQINEALDIAEQMDRERAAVRARLAERKVWP